MQYNNRSKCRVLWGEIEETFNLVLLYQERFLGKTVFIVETNLSLKGREERDKLYQIAPDKT